MSGRAVLLDRDGTLNVDRSLIYRLEQLVLIDGAIEGLRCLQVLRYALIVVANQSAVGQGLVGEEDVARVMRRCAK